MTEKRRRNGMSATDEQVRIGFIGIGAMGLPMARNLATAGYEVDAFDPSEAQRDRARELGITPTDRLGDLAATGALVVMVATPDQLLGLLEDPQLLGEGTSVRTVIVTSTVGPVALREFSDAAAARGVDVLDVAVTGGVAGADSAGLTLLTGGPAELLERVRPILERLGHVSPCGDRPGDGQAVKLVNNLLAAVNLAAAAEAVRFAAGLGLDPSQVVERMKGGAAGSWMLTQRGPRMALPREDRPFDTFAAILAKDAALIGAVAEQAGVAVPLLDVVHGQFDRVMELGWGREDDSCIVDLPFGSDPARGITP
jgi:3-hydroxyisobutyrate dehydrogenase